MESCQRVSYPGCGNCRWQVRISRRRQRGGVGPRCREGLETEPDLHFDDPGAKRVLRFAEVRVPDVGLEVRQIQLVQQVEEVGANLQPYVFAQHWQLGYAKAHAESCVHRDVAGASERMSGNPR